MVPLYIKEKGSALEHKVTSSTEDQDKVDIGFNLNLIEAKQPMLKVGL